MKNSYSRRGVLLGLGGLLLSAAIGGVLLLGWRGQDRVLPIAEADRVRAAEVIGIGRLSDALVAQHLAVADAAHASDVPASTLRQLADAREQLTSEHDAGVTALTAAGQQKIKRYVDVTDRIVAQAARGALFDSADRSSLLGNEAQTFATAYSELKSQKDALTPAPDAVAAAQPPTTRGGSIRLAAFLAFALFALGVVIYLWIDAQLLKPLRRVEAAAQRSLDRADVATGDGPGPQNEIDLAVAALQNAANSARGSGSRRDDPAGAVVSRRMEFEEELSQLIDRCRRHEQGAILALLRIRFFDRIAAAYGTAAAEHYAEAMLERLKGHYQAPARVFRYQRNILAVVRIGLPLDALSAPVDEIAQSAMHAFKAPVKRGADTLWSESHIAIALFPRDAADATALLRAAAATLENVGNDEQPGVFKADEKSAQKVREQMKLAERIRSAITSNEFQPYFQPIVDITSRKVKFVELLARWPGSNGLSASPSEFLKIAEDTDQAWQLSTLLFVKAAQAMKAWRGTGLRIPVCINVSGTLITPRLPGLIHQILQRTSMPADLLEVEITETAVFQNPEEAQAILRDLAALGVRLTLDDFGTGYSSLSYLLKLPISKIKIDQSFVSRVLEDRAAESIIRATISLAGSLGHCLVAEGISTRQISERMAELGCTVQQGFYFSPGLPPPEAIRWLQWWESPHHSQGRGTVQPRF